MVHTNFLKTVGVAALAAIILAVTMNRAKLVSASDEDNGDKNEESKIERGFDIAPVPLNLNGKNRALVGLGS
jgi:hypothetical protein